MPVFAYQTIQAASNGLYKEKGSKFMAFAYPVKSEEEIKEKIEALKKKYFDARHHCFAWILGAEKNRFRAFDDGEPNHSAGDPILGQIRSKDLCNVLVVVVRYFGGIKLGVGGLISAYKEAALDALNNAVVILEEVKEDYTVNYDYAATPEVMRLVKEFDLEIIQQRYEHDCSIQIRVLKKDSVRLLERIDLLRKTGFRVSV